MKRAPIRKSRNKPRPGRLKGDDLETLRVQRLQYDGWRCVECNVSVSDDLPDWHDRKAHMAHVQGKRMHGDSMDNVRTLCGLHHRLEHAYGKDFKKPCPSKQSVYKTPDVGPIWAEGGEK